jgi:hypothetical protein
VYLTHQLQNGTREQLPQRLAKVKVGTVRYKVKLNKDSTMNEQMDECNNTNKNNSSSSNNNNSTGRNPVEIVIMIQTEIQRRVE